METASYLSNSLFIEDMDFISYINLTEFNGTLLDELFETGFIVLSMYRGEEFAFLISSVSSRIAASGRRSLVYLRLLLLVLTRFGRFLALRILLKLIASEDFLQVSKKIFYFS